MTLTSFTLRSADIVIKLFHRALQLALLRNFGIRLAGTLTKKGSIKSPQKKGYQKVVGKTVVAKLDDEMFA